MKNITNEVYPKTKRGERNGGFYESDDGLVQDFRGGKFVKIYEQVCRENNQKREVWITLLRQIGIKAAHQDDGYHNRNDNYFSLAYPHFNDGVKLGDMVALGDYDKFVVLIVKKIGGFFIKRYYYNSSIR